MVCESPSAASLLVNNIKHVHTKKVSLACRIKRGSSTSFRKLTVGN